MILKEFLDRLKEYPPNMEIHLGESGEITSIYGRLDKKGYALVQSKDSHHEGLRWANTRTLVLEDDPIPHSPKPWSYVLDTRFTYEKYQITHGDKEQLAAGLSTVVAEISEGPHGLADARLIAYAPDLLTTLIDLADHVKELEGDRHCSGVYMFAKAIIKKAKGE
jgi:hypothetical protein